MWERILRAGLHHVRRQSWGNQCHSDIFIRAFEPLYHDAIYQCVAERRNGADINCTPDQILQRMLDDRSYEDIATEAAQRVIASGNYGSEC